MSESYPSPGRMVRDVPHASVEERAARGKDARKRTARTSHADWTPATDRPDPIALLEEQATTRMADLVPIRYGRMLESPFAYYRGAALAMATDLSKTPASGIKVQLCGDAHLSNFGVFDSPERAQLFDINDFDETHPGPWEWDVKRMAASFEIGLRQREATAAQRRAAVQTSVRAYREAMSQFSAMRDLEVWYARLDVKTVVDAITRVATSKDAKFVKRRFEKSRDKDNLRALSKLTTLVDSEPRFKSEPPLLQPVEELLTDAELEHFPAIVEGALKTYRATLPDDRRVLADRYQFVQMARKVVGVGSVGTRAWVMLLLGKDGSDPLFLQLKEAEDSVLERFLGKSRYRHHGRRVVEGQRLMQASSDITLGWFTNVGFDNLRHDYYVRQLWDGKFSVDPAVMPLQFWEPYARMCGWTLARAHARSGDPVAMAAYLGTGDTFDKAIGTFAANYADQTERDYEALVAAEKSGRIVAERGV